MSNKSSMQSIIMVAFATMSISVILIMGIIMYIRWYSSAREDNIRSTQDVMEQTTNSVENYLHRMRQISDTAYYNIVKENDILDTKMQDNLNLLYETNKDSLMSIAIYAQSGELLVAEPLADEKESNTVTEQSWFVNALRKVENMHFSAPHIQNIFDDGTGKIHWVISLSRAVDITRNDSIRRGILLIDMDYAAISDIMEQVNLLNNETYYYLCDRNGQIVYHPKQVQIAEGIYSENNEQIATYENGLYEEKYQGKKRTIIVDTIGYTGWRLVSVNEHNGIATLSDNAFYFIIMLIALMVMTMLFVSQLVSNRISNPLRMLDDSVIKYEAGEKPDIYIGGTSEIRHLSESIRRYYEQIELLMAQDAKIQNERRKSELEALQSQINPHFLYNTLDSITWMIESGKNDEASLMISHLARLFRISLSKGKTIISIGSELQHAESYMNIQKMRYKDAFEVEYNIDDELKEFCIVKLVLQPLLENAINYGLEGADDARILVSAHREESDLYISVRDNGAGMPSEEAALVLKDSNRSRTKGSGVGLINVNNRIKILFGEEYGIIFESEADEGTCVTIHIPAIPFSPENCQKLEGEDEKE